MDVVDDVDEHQNEEDPLFDADFQEVKSRKKEPAGRDGSKPDRRGGRDRVRSKPGKETGSQPPQSQAPATTTSGPQPLMSQGK